MANWDDGANLRQWFKRILFNEMSVASAPRKRGVRSSATTSPPDAFIITVMGANRPTGIVTCAG